MRRDFLVLAVCGLVSLTPSAVASSLVDVHGELEYLQSGRLEGFIGSDAGAVLHSGATDAGVPSLRQFLLKADQVNVVSVRTYADAPGPLQQETLEFIAPTRPTESEEIFTAVDLKLLSITPEWNFLLYSPDAASPAHFRSLGAGAYQLSNTEAGATLLNPDTPHAPAMDGYLAGADATKDGQLRVRTDFLSSEVKGTFNLVLYGAKIRLLGDDVARDFSAGRHTTKEAGPLGLPVERTVNDVVLLRVRDGTFRLLHEGPGLDLYAPQFHFDGHVELDDATGHLAWPSNSERLDKAPVALEGSLLLAARGAPREDSEGTAYGPLSVSGQAVSAWQPAASLAPAVLAASAALAVAAAGTQFIPGVRRATWALLGLFSMVGKGDALQHGGRSQLLEHVRGNPGTTLSSAQRDLGMGWGTIGYHVSVLERLGLLVTKRSGGKRLLFAQGQSRLADPSVWSALQNPSARQLVDGHFSHGLSLTASRAAELLGRTTQYAGRLLRRLAQLGLLEIHGTPHRAVYVPTALLIELNQRAEQVPLPSADVFGRATPVPVAAAPPLAMATAASGPRLTL